VHPRRRLNPPTGQVTRYHDGRTRILLKPCYSASELARVTNVGWDRQRWIRELHGIHVKRRNGKFWISDIRDASHTFWESLAMALRWREEGNDGPITRDEDEEVT
jgi:hypothetical protein